MNKQENTPSRPSHRTHTHVHETHSHCILAHYFVPWVNVSNIGLLRRRTTDTSDNRYVGLSSESVPVQLALDRCSENTHVHIVKQILHLRSKANISSSKQLNVKTHFNQHGIQLDTIGRPDMTVVVGG